MAVVIRYNPQNLTRELYDSANAVLMKNAPEGPPSGDLMVHVLFGDDGSLQVSEIWSSEGAWREAWEGFLGPSLEEAGIQASPEVLEAQMVWGAGVPGPPMPA
jgi:hypothetical protein